MFPAGFWNHSGPMTAIYFLLYSLKKIMGLSISALILYMTPCSFSSYQEGAIVLVRVVAEEGGEGFWNQKPCVSISA